MINEKYFYIKSEKARDLLEQSKKMKPEKSGTRSKVFFIDGFALLKTESINLLNIDAVIEKLHELKERGVNVIPILGYCFDPEKSDNFYIGERLKISQGKGCMFQPQAVGAPLQSFEVLANVPNRHFDKFIADFKKITDAGIFIDACEETNFFYDKQNGFSFIDLNMLASQEQKIRQSAMLEKFKNMRQEKRSSGRNSN